MSEIFIFKAVIILSILLFLLPVSWKPVFGIVLHVALSVITTTWAIQAWTQQLPVALDLGIPFWGGTPFLILDRLSAFFVILINGVCLAGAVYGAGYIRPYQASKSNVDLSVHAWAQLALHASMLHVVMMREGFAFLMAWEVMSMSSFLLVIFEGENEENLKTGIKYLIQMHAGFTLLLLGFLWVSQTTGIFGFDGLAPYFSGHSNWAIFLLLFTGFGIKAGFMPLHTWLPHAHPAAPSSVSGVMSGVMIKMGIYGILRVLMVVQADFLIIGIVVLAISMVTGLVGILYASMQRDLKKLLAYSSIENIGIIGVGIGVAILGRFFENAVLTTLGLAGALLHILNHAVYKSMLFFSAGNVYYATHTRDMNRLGGLMKGMPVSGGLFLIGALAISAIPPFNGFISEFLIYKSVFQGIGTGDFIQSMVVLAVILTLVVIGGLSVYTFTKAFGISFLGSSRSTLHVEEVPKLMRGPGIVSVALMVIIAVFAPWMVTRISEVGALFTHLNFQSPILIGTLPSFGSISVINIVVFGSITAVFLLRRITRRGEETYGPTWGCGYSAGDSRHQYTATSYSQYMRDLAGPVVATQEAHTLIDEKEIFPGARGFRTQTKDLIEEHTIVKPVDRVMHRMAMIGWAQTGKISHYLVYPLVFLLIIVLLTRIGLL